MPRAVSARQRSSSRFIARVLAGAKPAPFPAFIEPSLATLRSKVPAGARFVHELKFDGYRIQADLLDGRCIAPPLLTDTKTAFLGRLHGTATSEDRRAFGSKLILRTPNCKGVKAGTDD
jgi:hypothetical protein